MDVLIKQLGNLELDEEVTALTHQLKTLIVERGEVRELTEMFSKLRSAKAVKAKWAAWNRQRKKCVACGSTVRRGGWADHRTTKKHKRNARKLKRHPPKANTRNPKCTGSFFWFFDGGFALLVPCLRS